MECIGQGQLAKMQVTHNTPIEYRLRLGEQNILMNELIGKDIKLEYLGLIHCQHCGRKTNKSFSQGYCYPCMKRLAQCDRCIMSPELCHFAQGTCREPEWGEANCNIPHIVYLANSSNLKVGITRGNQVPTRWIDQGAVQAMPIALVATRRLSGLVEDAFKAELSDKTNWRTMLKGHNTVLDMHSEWAQIKAKLAPQMQALQDEHGLQAITWVDDPDVYAFDYPVLEYLTKITSFNLDKNPVVEGRLQGIKAQYLIFETGVINLRKYTSYNIALSA